MNNLCPLMSTAEKEAYCKTNSKFYEYNSTDPCGFKNAIDKIYEIDERLAAVELNMNH